MVKVNVDKIMISHDFRMCLEVWSIYLFICTKENYKRTQAAVVLEFESRRRLGLEFDFERTQAAVAP